VIRVHSAARILGFPLPACAPGATGDGAGECEGHLIEDQRASSAQLRWSCLAISKRRLNEMRNIDPAQTVLGRSSEDVIALSVHAQDAPPNSEYSIGNINLKERS
jgi:hypothetical protein